jgi:ABC-type dipeptide/oligopeptide/nickel transport system permease component
MYKLPTYLVGTLFSYLFAYIWDLFPTELVTKVEPNSIKHGWDSSIIE